MERRLKVELFEEIRREYEHGCGTIIGTAQKFGVHRRMVRQAIECALPPERKKPERKRTKFSLVKSFIEQILRDDERAPRKQRHTAHRIFSRLQTEIPEVSVSERSRQRRRHWLGGSGAVAGQTMRNRRTLSEQWLSNCQMTH